MAGVPHDHLAGAVLPAGVTPLEVLVFERMILGRHGQPLLGRVLCPDRATGTFFPPAAQAYRVAFVDAVVVVGVGELGLSPSSFG
jgi:hypothetical protein